MKKVLKKDEKKLQKDEKEDTTADVPKEDVKDDQPAQDAVVDNSEQEKKAGACCYKLYVIAASLYWFWLFGEGPLAPFLL